MREKEMLFEMEPKAELQMEKAQKPKDKKKIPLIYWIGGGIFILLLIAGIGLSFFISQKSAEASQTPLLKGPELREDPSKISTPSRTEQYASDIKNRKRNEKKEAIEKDRLNRIAMRWEDIYKGEEDKKADVNEKESRERESDRYPSEVNEEIDKKAAPSKREKDYRSAPKREEERIDKPNTQPTQKERILARREEAAWKDEILFNTLEKKEREGMDMPIGRVGGIIDGDQKIRAGQYIKFRLTESLEIPGGDILPINTPLMGLCSFGNSRIKAEVGAIYFQGALLPIKLKLFDSGLIEGIAYNDPRIRAQEQREIESAGAGLYDDLFYDIPYAGAFLNAGRNVLRKRSQEKSRKVSLTNNYRVIFQVYLK